MLKQLWNITLGYVALPHYIVVKALIINKDVLIIKIQEPSFGIIHIIKY